MAENLDVFAGAGGSVAVAAALARAAHEGQTDKAGVPYFEHCRGVALKLDDDDARTVALLHDVLEDTATSESELRAVFADEIVDAVVAITRLQGEDPDDYYERVAANPLALRVKRADIQHNLEPARLAALDEETRLRLTEKYRKVLAVLSE